MIVETEAIVLHTRKYGDTSKIVTLYTLESGKINLLAKGSRSPKSGLVALLEPLNHIHISFYKKSTRELQLLSKADSIQSFKKIHDSYPHLCSALLILESLIESQHESEQNEELFRYTLHALELLNELKAEPYAIFFIFQVILSEVMGFHIEIRNELTSKSENGYYFYSFENGTVFAAGNHVGRNLYRFDSSLLTKFRQLLKLNLDNYERVKLEKEDVLKLINFFAGYFSYHFDKKFSYRTLDLI